MVNSSRGRPTGGSDARERLLHVARTRFFEDGYAATSVRAIAREAGVDHTLVNYYFGSKQELFGAVMALAVTPSTLLGKILSGDAKDPAQLAHRIVATVIAVFGNPKLADPLIAMLRQSLSDDSTRVVVGEFLNREIISQLAQYIGGPDATRRATGVATVIVGTIFTRYLEAVEPIASMAAPDVIRTMTPMVAVHLHASARPSGTQKS